MRMKTFVGCILIGVLNGCICSAKCSPFNAFQTPAALLKPLETKPKLLIFVSFSMPEQSLKLWSEQAARVNGQLFIRGFLDNSLEKTTAKTMALFGKEKNGELLIDPNAFEQYHIKSVPAVVISQPDNCFDEHCPAPQFDIAYGDTALAEALELIVVKGSTAGKQTAKTLLQRVRAHD